MPVGTALDLVRFLPFETDDDPRFITLSGAAGTPEREDVSFETGDIVVMDNLGAHKNERTLCLITQAGAQARFLPAYSPDLNPIEMMWSKVKALLRKAQARTHPDLLAAIASALAAVTPQDALGWFTYCGYSFI